MTAGRFFWGSVRGEGAKKMGEGWTRTDEEEVLRRPSFLKTWKKKPNLKKGRLRTDAREMKSGIKKKGTPVSCQKDARKRFVSFPPVTKQDGKNFCGDRFCEP